MQAICFRCAEPKAGALDTCRKCGSKPANQSERSVSLCLSSDCLSQKNLVRAREYVLQKGKLPRFHPKVENKAQTLLQQLSATDLHDDDDSVELPSSFFDMDSNDTSQSVCSTILVHAIGKPRDFTINQPLPRGANGKFNTYHTLEWVIGEDISASDAESNMLEERVLFVWYRWLGNKWAWKCVTPAVFSELRRAES